MLSLTAAWTPRLGKPLQPCYRVSPHVRFKLAQDPHRPQPEYLPVLDHGDSFLSMAFGRPSRPRGSILERKGPARPGLRSRIGAHRRVAERRTDVSRNRTPNGVQYSAAEAELALREDALDVPVAAVGLVDPARTEAVNGTKAILSSVDGTGSCLQ